MLRRLLVVLVAAGALMLSAGIGLLAADWPFLYLVTEDEAYVVNGASNSAAASAYRNICS